MKLLQILLRIYFTFFIDFYSNLQYNLHTFHTLWKETATNMATRKLIIIFITSLVVLSACSDAELVEPEPTPRPTPPPPILVDYEPECYHFWKNPDCQNPYTCYDCDETEGEPLEHEWTEPNYQEAATCIDCGEIDGEPLEPMFLYHGYRINTTSGRPFDYLTITNRDPTMTTTGIATLLYIDIFESDDDDYPIMTGYEYIRARIMIITEDENARRNGLQSMTGHIDYFDFDPNEAAVIHNDLYNSSIPDFKIGNSTLNYFGEEYQYYIKHTRIQDVWADRMLYLVIEYTFLVPVGYDGIVVYLSNAANWTEDRNRVISDNFDDDTLFFRLRIQSN